MSGRATLSRMARRDDGQAMVEFALVLPIILLLLFGMLQVALVLNARQTVAYAAQAATNGYAQTLQRAQGDARARSAAAQLRPDFARAGRVEYSLIRGTDETRITADGVGAFGDLVVARVTYDYPSPVRAGIGGFRFPDAITLSAEAVTRVETPGNAGATTAATTAGATTSASAGCFYFNGFPTLSFPLTGLVVDGSPVAMHRYFAPGSSHSLLATLRFPGLFFGSSGIPLIVPITLVAPASGVVGSAYDVRHEIPVSGSLTGTITIVTRVTGTAAENCVQGQGPR